MSTLKETIEDAPRKLNNLAGQLSNIKGIPHQSILFLKDLADDLEALTSKEEVSEDKLREQFECLEVLITGISDPEERLCTEEFVEDLKQMVLSSSPSTKMQ